MAKRSSRKTRSAAQVSPTETPEVAGPEGQDEAPEVLADNTLPDIFTNQLVKATDKEQTLQEVARALQNEYGFSFEELARDFRVDVQVVMPDGKTKRARRKADIVVFEDAGEKEAANVIRVCVVVPRGTRGNDPKSGVQLLEDLMGALENCEFGLWTAGESGQTFLQKDTTGVEPRYEEVADFPGKGERPEDLGARRAPRTPAGQSLLQTFKRAHDYIYGNQGLKKDAAFWELVNLLFCKIYDERHPTPRRFWVGIKERNTAEGQRAIAARIKSIFNDVKQAKEYRGIFDSTAEIRLNDRVLAYIASELARYSILRATVDVKGAAYEEITSSTLKAQRGQFFTPRNIVRFMVDMLDPGEGATIIDPACGSGGFLVEALDHVREKVIDELYSKSSQYERLLRKEDSAVIGRMQQWASSAIFGVDFDPDLKRAARMNMVMNNDGHGNIYSFNSLEYPEGNDPDVAAARNRIRFGTFDFVFTNPPFGTKIPVDDPVILREYELARRWRKDERGQWLDSASYQAKMPPEILFVECCYRFLKPGTGRMAIVLPDGILGNPDLEYVRAWILRKMQVLASVDLPVEAFLPQVGVQASLLFLRRKSEQEITAEALGDRADYGVFMAVAEKVGRDRRGNTIYERDPDGAEILFDLPEEEVSLRNGEPRIRVVRRKRKKVDDDLGLILDAYRRYVRTGKLPEKTA